MGGLRSAIIYRTDTRTTETLKALISQSDLSGSNLLSGHRRFTGFQAP